MGLFKNIISKFSGLFLKNNKKALKITDIKQANKTVAKTNDGPQIRTGLSNFEHKSGFYEGKAVDHFAKYFADKNLQDVVEFVGDLKNFANPSEYEEKIKTLNAQRKQGFEDATMLTVEGLYQYLAGGQNLSEQDKKAYSLIAKQTQSRARALAYIKANFVGICNMKAIYGEEGDKAFAELKKIVKNYADASINGYTMPQFNPEVVNSDVYNADIYVKGATYAQRRCDDLLFERVDFEASRAQDNTLAIQNVSKNVKTYDKSIDEIAKRNKTIQDIDEKLAQGEKVLDKLAALKDAYDENEDEYAISLNWVKGSDIVKPAAERRDEFMNAFLKVARDFPVAYYDDGVVEGKTKGFSLIIDRDTLSDDLDNAKTDDFQVIFKNSLSPYDALVDAIAVYNKDKTTDHSNDIFKTKIEVDKHGSRKTYLYTTRQEKIMRNIFEIMKLYAQSVVNGNNYQVGDNLLENFKYKNVKHAPTPKQLKNVSDVIFGNNIGKDATIEVTFNKLNVSQLKTLCDFIRSNEAVSSFIESDKDIRDFEVDSLLLEMLDPSVANERDLKLPAVMNAMQREAIDSTIASAEEQIELLNKNKEENVAVRDENYLKADESLINLRKIKSEVEKPREVDSDSSAASETDNVRGQIVTGIDMLLAVEDLPENASTIDDNTQRIGKSKIEQNSEDDGKKVKTYADEISRIEKEANKVSIQIKEDQMDIACLDNSPEARAKYYELYFSSADNEKVLNFMVDIENIVTKIKAAEKAKSVEEQEVE